MCRQRVLPSIAQFIEHNSRDGGSLSSVGSILDECSRVFSLAASSSSWRLSITRGPRALLIGCSCWNIARRSMRTSIYLVFPSLLCLRGRLCRSLLPQWLRFFPLRRLLVFTEWLLVQGFGHCRRAHVHPEGPKVSWLTMSRGRMAMAYAVCRTARTQMHGSTLCLQSLYNKVFSFV